jgi:predicted dehydrogenase/threonine dehydrogenase-like Zn-dependent dehydrogenase
MRLLLQDLSSGETRTEDVPCPLVGAGQLLIRTSRSLISAGTERMLVEFGRANWIHKARSHPDKVRQVFDKVRTDGFAATLAAVRHKLDQPLALGYCNVGRVMEIGPDVQAFAVGDRVASNGPHAEVIAVPVNLCAKIPDGVGDDTAAFTVLSAIGLQGIRLLQPTLGESVVVTGLGLIGLLTVQLLKGNGCRVLGIDKDPSRLALAREFGAEVVDLAAGEDPVARGMAFSRARGVDGVLITASTDSNGPIRQAARMSRKRGRIVLVGVTGLELSRSDFYEKELSFQVSCSYGPGRYDPNYEQKGRDYPAGLVRWTEQRNFEAVLDTMADGRLSVERLISHRFGLSEASRAYDLLASRRPSLGILIDYPDDREQATETLTRRWVRLERAVRPVEGTPRLAFIGAGNQATRVLMPAMKAAGAYLKSVASASGTSAVHAARKFGFEEAVTDTESIFEDPDVDAVVISTRHDTHARFVLRALEAGKHVFVEKPLCLTLDELDEIEYRYNEQAEQGRAPVLMVGFNRRYAPLAVKMKSLLASVSEPKALIVTVNAGALPADHWTQDAVEGGGRIVGEACHFIDLLYFLTDSKCIRLGKAEAGTRGGDTVTLTLEFEDGSIGTIHYFANGNRTFPKERVEAFAAGKILQLDNFRKLRGYGWPGLSGMGGVRQDKGQAACCVSFLTRSRERRPHPLIDIYFDVTRRIVSLRSSGVRHDAASN